MEKILDYSFQKAMEHNVCVGDHVFPTALLVKEFCAGAIPEGNWTFHESQVYKIDHHAAEEVDKTLESLIKEYKQSQELFYICSHSQLF